MAIINSLTTTGVMKTIGEIDEVTMNYVNQGSMQFNGAVTGTGLTVTGTINNWGTSDFTVECWLNCSATHTFNFIICFQSAGAVGGPSLLFGGTTTGFLGWAIGSSGSGLTIEDSVTSTTRLPTGTWHHVAYTRQSGTGYLYVDGTQVGTGVDATNYSGTNTASSIGGYYTFAGSSFTGYISNVRITNGIRLYTGAFTPSSYPLATTQSAGTNIAAITNASSVRLLMHTNSDISTNAFPVAYVNNPSTSYLIKPPLISNSGIDGYSSIYFNGKSAASFSTTGIVNFGTADFTIEAWIYPTADDNSTMTVTGSTVPTDHPYMIFSTGSSSTGFFLQMQADNFSIGRPGYATDRVWIPAGGASGTRYFQYNTWYHLAVSKYTGSIGTAKFLGFVNGVLATMTGTTSTTFVATGGSIGATGGSSPYFCGYISNLRVVKGSGLYGSSGISPSVPTTALTSITNTQLLTSQSSSPTVENSSSPSTITMTGSITSANTTIPFASTYSSTGFTTAAYLSITLSPKTFSPRNDTTWTIEGWVYLTSIANFCLVSGRVTTTDRFTIQYTGTLFQVGDATAFPISVAWTPTINTWYHISVVKSSGTIMVYINGAILASAADTMTNYALTSLILGSRLTLYAITGYLSNFRFVKGTAVYTTTFTPSTVPLAPTIATTTASTTLLTAQSKIITDSSRTTAYSAITYTDSPITSSLSPFNLSPVTVTKQTSAGSLQTLWEIDETSLNADTYNQGSIYFSGTSSYLGTGVAKTDAVMVNDITDFTIECWLYGTDANVSIVTRGIYQMATATGTLPTNATTYAGLIANSQFGFSNSTTTWYFGEMVTRTWIHYAVSRKNNVLSFYTNGILRKVVVENGTAMYALSCPVYYFILGGYNTTAFLWKGFISNFRMVKGTAVYYALPFTTPTVQITSSTQNATTTFNKIGKLLTAQSATIIDNSSYSRTIYNYGSVTTGNSIIPFANTYSYQFNGTNQYLMTDYSTDFSIGFNDFSIDFWTYVTVSSGRQDFFWMKSSNNSSNIQLGIYHDGTSLIFNSNGTARITYPVALSTLQNTWKHIALYRSINSGSTSLYVNGVLVGGWVNTDSYGDLSYDSRIIIGRDEWGSTYMTGYISNLRFVTTQLPINPTLTPAVPTSTITTTSQGVTAGQVALLTAQSASTTLSSNYVGPGTPTYISSSTYGAYLSGNSGSSFTVNTFNGPGQPTYIGSTTYLTYFNNTPNLSIPTFTPIQATATTAFAIECWFYLTSFTGCVLATSAYSGSGNIPYAIGFSNGSDPGSIGVYPYFASFDGGSWSTALYGTNGCITDTWYHYAATYDGTTLRLFINGSLANSVVTATPSQTSTTTTGYYIGRRWDGNEYFSGYISNFRFVQGSAVYTSAFTPSGPLTNIANTKLLTLQSSTIIDNSSSPYAITTVGTLIIFPTTDTFNLGTAPRFSFGTGNFTIECWCYPTAAPASSWTPIIGIAGTSSQAGAEFRISQNINGTGFGFLHPNNTMTADVYTGFGTLTLNTWHHLALVRIGSTISFYRNGTYVGGTSGVSFTFNKTVLYVGQTPYGGNDGYFNGYISNLRIVKGTGVYTGNFTPAGPLSRIQSSGTGIVALSGSETVLLTFQNSTFIDNSVTPAYLTDTTLISINDLTNPTISSPIVTAGNSFIPFANTYSYEFNRAKGTYLKSPQGYYFTPGIEDFTIEFWAYPTISSGTQVWFYLVNDASGSNNIYVYHDGTNLIYRSNGTNVISYTVSLLSLINRWSHIALVRYNLTSRLFLNGVNVGTIGDATAYTNLMRVYIGRDGPSSTSAISGLMSNFRMTIGSAVYTGLNSITVPTTALTSSISVSTTKLLTAQSATIVDNSGNTSVSIGQPTYMSSSTYGAWFNGGSNYITVPTGTFLTASNTYTIEMWINPTSYPGGSNAASLYQITNATVSNFGGLLLALYGSGYVQFDVRPNTNASNVNLTSSSKVPLNTWSHIAVVVNSGAAVLYINGVSSATGTVVVMDGTQTFCAIGRLTNGYTTNQSYYNGYISNLRIVKVTAVYTANFTPSGPLTNITNTSLLTLKSATLIDTSTANGGSSWTLTPTSPPPTVTDFSTSTLFVNNNSVTTSNSVIPFAGTYSYQFNGTNQYLVMPYSSIWHFPSGPFCIEAWVYLNATTVYMPIINQNWNYGSTAPAFAFWIDNSATNGQNNSGGVFPQFSTSSADPVFARTSSAFISVSTWTHIAVTRDSLNTFRSFINGKLNNYSPPNANKANPIASASGSIYIGVSSNLASPYFNGYISNLRVSTVVPSSYSTTAIILGTQAFTPGTTALTTTPTTNAVKLLTAQSATIVDNSSYAYTLTNYPGIVTSGSYSLTPFDNTYSVYFNGSSRLYVGYGDSAQSTDFEFNGLNGLRYMSTDTYAARFNGVNNYLTIASTTTNVGPVGTEDFTVEFWTYQPFNYGIYPRIFESWPYVNSSFQLVMSGGTFYVASNGNTNLITYNISRYADQWIHIAVTRSASEGYLRLYINGITVAWSRASGTWDYSFVGAGTWAICRPEGSGPRGYVSNFRVVRGSAVYTGWSFTPSGPLTNITNTVLLTCQDSTIVDNGSGNNKLPPYIASSTYGTYFNGSSQNLTISSFSPVQATATAAFAIECWVNNFAFSGCVVATNAYGGSGTIPYTIGFTNQSDPTIPGAYPYFASYNGSSWNIFLYSSTACLTNTWYHFAVSYDGTTLRLFINGSVVNSLVTATPSQTSNTNTGYYIGRRWDLDGSNYFSGVISNFRFVQGSAVYTGAFTPSGPLTNITNTKLLTLQSSTFVDNSTTPYTITNVGTLTLTNFTSIGSAFTITNNNSVITAPITISSIDTVWGTSNFTVELWLNFSTHNSGGGILSCGDNNSPWYGWEILFYSTYNFLQLGLGTNNTYNGNIWLDFNKWYHIALVRNIDTITLYVNGVADIIVFYDQWLGNTVQTLFIGDTRGNGAYFTGYMSNLRIVVGTAVYTSAFTPPTTPLTAISGTKLLTCQSTTIVDNSSKARTITTGTGTVTAGKRSIPFDSTYTYQFNGYGSFVTGFGPPALTGDFNIEMWVNGNSIRGNYPVLLGKNSPYSTTGQYYICYRHTNASDRISIHNWTLGNPFLSSNTVISDSTWYHVAIVRSNSYIKMYINGVFDNQYTTADTSTWDYSNFVIGCNPLDSISTTRFGGLISNLRIVGAQVYALGFTAPTTAATIPSASVEPVKLITAQSSTIVDNSSNSFTLSATPNQNATYYYGTAPEISNTVIPFANTYSWKFNGSTSVVKIGGMPSDLAAGTSDFTAEAWIYPTAPIARYAVIFAGIDYGNSDDFGLYAGQWQGGRFGPSYKTGGGDEGSTVGGIFPTELEYFRWYHIAATREGTTVRLFIDGVLRDINSSSLANITSTSYHAIGNTGGYGARNETAFTGYISNLRVVNGTAIYSTSSTTINATIFTPPTSALTTSSQGATPSQVKLLTCQSSTFINNGTGNIFFITPGTGVTSTNSIIPFANTYSYVFGGSYNAYTYLSIPPAGNSFLFTGNFTIEAWVYFMGNSSDAILEYGSKSIFGSSHPSTNTVFDLRYNNGTAQWQANFNTQGTLSTTSIIANRWYHIALVRNSTTVTLYLDGVNTGTLTVSGDVGYASTHYFIGGSDNTYTYTPVAGGSSGWSPSAGTTNPFGHKTGGLISNLRVVNGTAVYTANFTKGALTYISSDTYYGTFNGSTTYLTVPYNSNQAFGTDNFTVEAWIYPTTVSSLQRIISSWYAVGGQFIIELTAAGKLYFNYTYTGDNQSSFTTTTGITANVWTHIAVVRNGATIRFYINGVADVTTNNIGAGTSIIYYGGVQKNIIIGYDASGPSRYFNGNISNLRIVIGTAVYTGNFTPSGPLSSTQSSGTNISAISGSNTKLLTLQSSTFIDNSSTGSTITATGSPTITSLTVAYINSLPAPPTTSLTAIANTVLLTCQSSDVADNSSNNMILYSLGNVSTTNSVIPFSNTYSFRIAGGGLESQSSSLLNFGTADFTIEAWVYPKQVPSTDWLPIIVINDPNVFQTGGREIRLSQNIANYGYGFLVPDNNGSDSYYSVGFDTTTNRADLPLNTWTHLALTRVGKMMRLYNNGSLVLEREAGSFDYSKYHTTSVVRIGHNVNQPTDGFFVGYVSNVRITSGPAIYELQSGNFTPPSTLQIRQASGTNISAITGDQTTLLVNTSSYGYSDISSKRVPLISNSAFGAYGANPTGTFQGPRTPTSGYYSYSFDGSKQYLTVPANAAWAFGTGDFTVECWVFITTVLTGGAFVGPWTGTGSTSAWVFTQGNSSTSNLRFGVSDGTTTTFVEGAGGLSTNMWIHIAAVRSSGTIKLYSNGTSVYSGALATNISVSSQALQINGVAGLTFLTTGYISNLRIVKGTAVYTTTFSPSSTPLTNITNTVLLTCQSSTIVDNSTANSGNGFTITAITPGGNYATIVNNLKPFQMSANPTITSGTTIRRQYNTGEYQVIDSFDEWGLTSSVTPSVYFVSEGDTVTFSIYLRSFGTGTAYWTNSGSTVAADFSDAANSGSISITNDIGTLSRTLASDVTIEGGETITIQIRSVSISGTILVTSTPVWVYDISTGVGQALAAYPTTTTGTGIANTGTGTFNWICPPGVTSISVVAVGGGGGGGSSTGATVAGVGGGGGGLGYKNSITVVPGTTYAVVAGAGGTSTFNAAGTAGGDSYFINTSTVKGGGGAGGNVTVNNGVAAGRDSLGGTYTGDGGGNGGKGGGYKSAAAANRHGGGGGGAGGYAGAGGDGAIGDILTGAPVSATAGAGGGGGGGGYINILAYSTGGAGGGVNLYGQGDSGAAGSNSTVSGVYDNTGGWGGSYTGISSVSGAGGVNGNPGTANASANQGAIGGAQYGGGASGPVASGSGTPTSGPGGPGAVRIIWGSGRSFPSTNTGDL